MCSKLEGECQKSLLGLEEYVGDRDLLHEYFGHYFLDNRRIEMWLSGQCLS
jgi:hypothetical protein